MFTEREVAYLKSQPLVRIATVSPDGQPDAAPVGLEFDGRNFIIGGHNPESTRKYANVRAGNHKVALVVDDLESVQPWKPRGIRIYGTAELVQMEGRFGSGVYLRITPAISWSWGIEDPTFDGGKFGPHKTLHETG